MAAIILSFHQQTVGMGAIIAYSAEIAKSAYPSIEKIFPILINSLAVFCILFTQYALKYLGTRKSLLFGGLSISICLFFLAGCLSNFNPS